MGGSAEKVCFKCGRQLPLAEFYKHPMMADGHLNKCKNCTKLDAAGVYKRKVATVHGVESERARGREKYRRLGYRTKYRRKRRGRPEYPGTPELKRRARIAFANAVRDGHVTRPDTCSECGREGKIHGHHTDYTKPFEVDWLCSKCHARRHTHQAARVLGD